MFDRGELTAAIAAHGPVTRIVIVDHKGSTPRETGTAMLVWESGQTGTIGGGALELQAVEAARRLTGTQVIQMPLGPALGQCCGGAVTLVLERFDSDPAGDEPFARRITGTRAEPMSIKRALANHRRSGLETGLIWADGWLCEQTTAALQPLWIYGAGHVGRALVDVLDGLPFAITWVDTARDRFPATVSPDITLLPTANPAKAAQHAPDTADHLILTYSHALDLELCHALVARPAGFVGLIGSATKWARFRSRLAALGHDAASIARITCPIGDPSLGKHPKAIALGVAAQLMHRARQDNHRRQTA